MQPLHQVAEQASQISPLMVAWVAGGSAVAGSLVTGLLSYFGMRQSIKSQYKIEHEKLQANLVSSERLRWLQDLRSRLASAYAQMDMQYSLIQRDMPAEQHQVTQKQIDDLSMEIMNQANVIYLMLKPDGSHQQTLRDALQKAQKFLIIHFSSPEQARTESSFKAYTAIKQEAFNALTQIGMDTWRQVKALQ